MLQAAPSSTPFLLRRFFRAPGRCLPSSETLIAKSFTCKTIETCAGECRRVWPKAPPTANEFRTVPRSAAGNLVFCSALRFRMWSFGGCDEYCDGDYEA